MAYQDLTPMDGDSQAVVLKKLLQRMNTGVTILGGTEDGGASSEIVVIEHAHRLIHEGSYYHYTDFRTLANDGNDYNWIFTVAAGAVSPHFFFNVTVDGAALVLLHETPVTVSGGSAGTVQNRNRNYDASGNVVTVTTGATVGGSDGTLLRQYLLGKAGANPAQGGAGGVNPDAEEFVLKPGTSYLIRALAADDNVSIALNVEWYQETNE